MITNNISVTLKRATNEVQTFLRRIIKRLNMNIIQHDGTFDDTQEGFIKWVLLILSGFNIKIASKYHKDKTILRVNKDSVSNKRYRTEYNTGETDHLTVQSYDTSNVITAMHLSNIMAVNDRSTLVSLTQWLSMTFPHSFSPHNDCYT